MTILGEVERVLREWADAERPEFEATYKNLKYEMPHYSERRDYVALDAGSSGAFLVEKSTGNVFGIRGYGTPDRRKYMGRIQDIDGAKLFRFRWMRPNLKVALATGVPGPDADHTRREVQS